MQLHLLCFANNQLKNILRKFFNLINLSGVQGFHIYKMAKVVVICKNKNFMLIVFQVVLSNFECFNTSKEFAIMDFILSFNRNFFFKKNFLLDDTGLNQF